MLELLEGEGAVVERGGHAEAIFDQGLLAGAVSVVHAAHLRNGLVGLVDEKKKILGHVVEQRGRGFAGKAAGEMARIVFDAVAIADGAYHLHVKHGALPDALRFDVFAFLFQLGLPPGELFENAADGALFLLGGQNVVGFRIDGQARKRLAAHFAG